MNPNDQIVDLDAVLAAYERQKPDLTRFLTSISRLVSDCLQPANLHSYNIEERVKPTESVRRTLGDGQLAGQDPLRRITDLVGLRVITSFPDEVDHVCELLAAVLDVIERDDKRAAMQPDQFGYLSVHLVVRISPDRAKLPEWTKYSSLVAEIQVRSILQHAWAMVSRALMYKKEWEAPTSLRRKLHRLAGLFEVADDYFLQIRESEERLKTEAEGSGALILLDEPLDLISLTQMFRRDEFRRAVMRVMDAAPVHLDPEPHSECWRRLLATCRRIGLSTTKELHEAMASMSLAEVRAFAERLDYYRPPSYCPPLFSALALLGTTRTVVTEEQLSEDEWRASKKILEAKGAAPRPG